MEEKYLKLICTGREQCVPAKKVGPCVRNVYILHYVCRGRGVLESGGKRYAVSAGQVFFIRPWEPVCYAADARDPWEYIWADFAGEEAEGLLAATAFSKVPVTPVLDGSVRDLFSAMSVGRNAADACEGNGRLRLAIAALMRAYPAAQGEAGSRDTVSFAVERIRARYYDSEFSVAELAREAGFSRSHFYRLFARETGMSPMTFLRLVRLERAMELVRRSQLSVKEIAYSVGYADALYFSSEYSRHYGRSPLADRRGEPPKVAGKGGGRA